MLHCPLTKNEIRLFAHFGMDVEDGFHSSLLVGCAMRAFMSPEKYSPEAVAAVRRAITYGGLEKYPRFSEAYENLIDWSEDKVDQENWEGIRLRATLSVTFAPKARHYPAGYTLDKVLEAERENFKDFSLFEHFISENFAPTVEVV